MIDGPIKLLFAGPVGSGKTTALRCLSDVEIISTDVPMSEGASGDKTTTTVALDYSTIHLDDDTPIHLYGIPGQEHFSFMRPIVANGALGAIVLLDATSHTLQEDCEHWLNSLREIDASLQIVVGVSKTDIAADFSLGDVREGIRNCGMTIPAMCVDPRNLKQCSQLLRALLLALD